ncbi:MAG: hypothetical protein RBQ82_01705 [Synergistaceae bacterium]|nr:hypothetical protein [Synergistaceae bacterium]
MYYSIGRKLVRIEEKGDIATPFAAVLHSDEFNGGDLPSGFSGSDLPRYPKASLLQSGSSRGHAIRNFVCT